MKTVKRLILLEATFQRIPSYEGTVASIMPVHGCTELVDRLSPLAHANTKPYQRRS